MFERASHTVICCNVYFNKRWRVIRGGGGDNLFYKLQKMKTTVVLAFDLVIIGLNITSL